MPTDRGMRNICTTESHSALKILTDATRWMNLKGMLSKSDTKGQILYDPTYRRLDLWRRKAEERLPGTGEGHAMLLFNG